MKRILLILALSSFSSALLAQNNTPDFGIKFSGFVNSQVFYDSYQMLEAREGMVSLFPKKPEYDLNGIDLNNKSSFNQLGMTSRLRANITSPDILGASIKGVIEGDFTGVSNTDNNGFRLREAYVQLNWDKTSLLVGSYWHPLYLFESRPATIGLNTGAPFHAFSRHNQIRIEQTIGISKFILFAGMQRDYSSSGIEGKTPSYQRNALIPNLHFQYQLIYPNLFLGFGLDYKQIMPLLSLENGLNENFRITKKLNSFSYTFFGKLELEDLSIKAQFIRGQNLSEHIMLGGYILDNNHLDPEHLSYENVAQQSYWFDVLSKGKTIKIGFFAGYAANKAGNLSDKDFFGMGANIDYLYRIAPRIQFHSNKFMWATEFEYTVASYFNSETAKKSNEIGNLRILTALFFFF